MTKKEIELDVDFIGGQGSLTAEEEKTIHEFLKSHRISSTKRSTFTKRPKSSNRAKASA